MSNALARASHEKWRRLPDRPSSNTPFFAAVIHVTEPLNRRNSGVVRTTSPVAPSLTIKTFMLGQNISRSRAGKLMLFPSARVTRSQAYFRGRPGWCNGLRSCQLLPDLLRMLIEFNQFSLDKFQRQNLVYLEGIVSLTASMSFEDLFQRIGTKVGSAARVRVEKDL